ncbi:thioredoxin family protein [Carnobacterium gallinarum]|uniref:thioredoxin family protein n=1 Tax=Carnobacterium gallinarum TaxID=2749 RepID=UPI0005568E27|nr:thioredoxin family protein [Carnobacterium gallinarum]
MKIGWKIWSVAGVILVSVAVVLFFTNQAKPVKEKASPNIGIENVNAQKIVTLFDEKKDGLVYIGRPTCDKCQAFQPLLENALATNKQNILYYNTDDGKKADVKTFEDVIAKTEITSVPAVLVIKNGQVTQRLDNYKDEAKINAFLAENE